MKLDIAQSIELVYKEIDDFLLLDHSISVGMLCLGVAKKIPLNDEDTRKVVCAGILHDVGKMHPSSISTHPEMSYNVLLQYDPDVAQIASCHHSYQKHPVPNPALLINVTEENKYLGQIVALCDKVEAFMARDHKSPKNAYYKALEVGIFDDKVKEALWAFITKEHKRNH